MEADRLGEFYEKSTTGKNREEYGMGKPSVKRSEMGLSPFLPPRDQSQQIADAIGVSPFIVVPTEAL
jgi:hypothetical protein